MLLFSASARESYGRTPSLPADLTTLAPFYTLDLVTSATNLRVLGTPQSGGNVMEVNVGGVFNQTVTWSGSFLVPEEKSITLPAGANKHVQLVAAGTGAGDSVVIIERLTGQFYYLSPSSPNIRVIWLGDSITTGASATPVFNGWAPLLANQLPAGWNSMNHGRFGQAMVSLVLNPTRIAETLASLDPMVDGLTQNIIVTALLTNDFAQGRSVAQVTSNVTTLRNSLWGAFGSRPGFRTIWVSPTQRFDQNTPNLSGAILSQLCTAEQSVAAGFGDTYFDGQTIFSYPSANLSVDGVHPTTAGHALILAAQRTILGI